MITSAQLLHMIILKGQGWSKSVRLSRPAGVTVRTDTAGHHGRAGYDGVSHQVGCLSSQRQTGQTALVAKVRLYLGRQLTVHFRRNAACGCGQGRQ